MKALKSSLLSSLSLLLALNCMVGPHHTQLVAGLLVLSCLMWLSIARACMPVFPSYENKGNQGMFYPTMELGCVQVQT